MGWRGGISECLSLNKEEPPQNQNQDRQPAASTSWGLRGQARDTDDHRSIEPDLVSVRRKTEKHNLNDGNSTNTNMEGQES